VHDERGDAVKVELWKNGQRVLLSQAETDSAGHFSVQRISSGSYEIRFVSAVAWEGFFLRIQGANIFRWAPNNWLEVGLGFVQPEGCAPSYFRARKNMNLPKQLPTLPQPTLENAAAERQVVMRTHPESEVTD